ncbi:MAG: thiamine diphosphokinase [Oscillospiraceae bacterium]|nr:thiamine diphosphokinase [Oscillospiraceae bacterium]
MVCYIAGAGEFSKRALPSGDDYVIAADAGYLALSDNGIAPDLVVGDFDSLGFMPKHPEVVCCPSEKDDTDLLIAVREGLARGHRSFVINGALGGRLDHTLANIQILKMLAQNGAYGVLVGHEVCVTALKNGTLGFAPGASGTISVFALGDKAEGVTLTGLKYGLVDAVLTDFYPIGTSNEFMGEAATITVKSGTLAIIWTGEPGELDWEK